VVSCELIGPLVVTRGMAFAVHGTAELAFTGAAAGLIVAGNPVAGALAGPLVVAALAAYSLRCPERARVSECLAAIRVIGRRRAWTRRYKRSGV
jgi:ABC-type Mn2+/Zn2+ transport system permease subunit